MEPKQAEQKEEAVNAAIAVVQSSEDTESESKYEEKVEGKQTEALEIWSEFDLSKDAAKSLEGDQKVHII